MTASPELMGAIKRSLANSDTATWAEHGTNTVVGLLAPGDMWVVCPRDAPGVLSVQFGYYPRTVNVDAPALTVALWALLHAAGLTVERPCPECASRGGGLEWRHRFYINGLETRLWDGSIRTTSAERDAAQSRKALESDGWSVMRQVSTSLLPSRYEDINAPARLHAARPCPSCAVDGKPTGRAHIKADRVLLDAMPQPDGVDRYDEDHGWQGVQHVKEYYPATPGDQAARDDLDVLATRLQDDGNPLGHVLALWLAGKLREEHVMGVETLSHEQMSARAGDGPMDAQAITMSAVERALAIDTGAAFTVYDYGIQQGWHASGHHAWWRPVLEARPV